MSWSISFIGKPENVAQALQDYVANSKIDGQSKIEFESALPSLVGLVSQNFGNQELIHISASGSGYAVNGEQQNRRCVVEIKGIYGALV